MTNIFHIFIIAVKHNICIVLISTWSWTDPHFSAFKSYEISKKHCNSSEIEQFRFSRFPTLAWIHELILLSTQYQPVYWYWYPGVWYQYLRWWWVSVCHHLVLLVWYRARAHQKLGRLHLWSLVKKVWILYCHSKKLTEMSNRNILG